MIQNPAEVLDDERMKELLARSLDRHMRKAGITQTELARRSGIGKSTLNTYFVRKSFPSPAKLQALADAFGLTVEELAPEVDRDEIRALAQGTPEDAGGPTYSVSALPDRPGFSRVAIRADLPTDVAMRIMALAVEAASRDAS